jgi:plasmid maintenance system antidote protein VapI
MELTPLNKRIIELMKFLDIRQTELAAITKVTRQTINGIVLGKSKPGASFYIELIKKYDNINARWLLTGKGQMLNTANPSETKINENNQDIIEKELYNTLRKDYNNLRNDIEEHKKTITFLQSIIKKKIKK